MDNLLEGLSMSAFQNLFPYKFKEKTNTVVDIKLSSLLGIDTLNSSSLTINIVDDLPTNINFKSTIGISTSKNFFLAALNKLFINPRSLKDNSKVAFEDFEQHVLDVEEKLSNATPKPTCSCGSSKKKKMVSKRITFRKVSKNACCG